MGPTLIINPTSDRDFERYVEAWPGAPDTPEALQAYLRQGYPAAVVRPRELSAELVVIWYVYRDGSWSRE